MNTKLKDNFVTCYFCRKLHGYLDPRDIPRKRHDTLFPDCSYYFLLKNLPLQKCTDSTNLPVLPKENEKVFLPTKQARIKKVLETTPAKVTTKTLPEPLIKIVLVNLITSTIQNLSFLPHLQEKIVEREKEHISKKLSSLGPLRSRCARMSANWDRLRTFKKWPYSPINIYDFVNSGFFYTGSRDFVKCFFCGNTLGGWKPTDNPLEVHEKLYPECGYLIFLKNLSTDKIHPHFFKTVKDKTGVSLFDEKSDLRKSKIAMESEDTHSECITVDSICQKAGFNWPTGTEAEAHSSHYQFSNEILRPKEENIGFLNSSNSENSSSKKSPKSQDLLSKRTVVSRSSKEKSLICRICSISENEIVFFPCRHLGSCRDCSDKISECSVCQRFIENRIQIYI